VIIRETKDIEEIKSILCHPEIFPRISGDCGLTAKKFEPPLEGVIYLGGYEDGIFAVSCFHCFRDGLKFHPNVLPEYRLRYARIFAKQCLSMLKCEVYAEVPLKYKRAINFAKKLGFDSIANNKDSTDTVLMRLL